MKFNNLSKIPPERRRLLLIAGIVIATPVVSWGVLSILIPFLSFRLTNLSNNEIIAALAVIVAMFSIALKLIDYVLSQQYASDRQILIKTEQKNDYVMITCTVENMGRKRIIPQNVYVFVDQGIEKQIHVEFPFCLKHEEGEDDCVLGKKCKSGGINSYPEDLLPDEFRAKYHQSFKLRNLSTESILFIDPGERFSEDLVLKLEKPSIYRVTAVWTAVNADCICATKQFVFMTSNFRNQYD